MRLLAGLVCTWLAVGASDAGEGRQKLVEGLRNIEALTLGSDGRVYAAVSKDGGGTVVALTKGQPATVVPGLEGPRALGAFQGSLYIVERQRVRKLDPKGKLADLATIAAFPRPPQDLQDIAVDPESGTAYVSDGSSIFRINPKGKVDVVTDKDKSPALVQPGGLSLDGASFLLVLDGAGGLQRVKIADGSTVKVADGLGKTGRLVWDPFGRLYVSDAAGGRVLGIARPGAQPATVAKGLKQVAGLCVDAAGKRLIVAEAAAGAISSWPAQVPGAEVDDTPLSLEAAVAFPELRWTGWSGETDKGLPQPLRPIVLTHAGDGSDRVFVATQHGVIHVFANDQKVKETSIFLDISPRVRYDDKTNEEGFLGLAFHPRFKDNGELFVFYTDRSAKLTNVLSRFRVRQDDPARGDPASEEQLLRVERPFWNHDGGTIAFGPDGYLYVALGDGGAANDPFDNAQNLKTLLGSVLRLDIDRKADGKPYAIPKDNPFVARADARPEIWAYGLRNVWRMAFDRKTGKLWAGDVGQNLYEEIDILRAGGNFGWKRREGLHPFESKGSGPRPELIEPIWEYRHDIGRSITGGAVYRGQRLPELEGAYLYGDYISTKLWALWYDEAKGRVVANRPLRDRNHALLSFGADEQGDIYYLTHTTSGQGIYRFERTQKR
jgi:glucose/arabinose dehydrogenase